MRNGSFNRWIRRCRWKDLAWLHQIEKNKTCNFWHYRLEKSKNVMLNRTNSRPKDFHKIVQQQDPFNDTLGPLPKRYDLQTLLQIRTWIAHYIPYEMCLMQLCGTAISSTFCGRVISLSSSSFISLNVKVKLCTPYLNARPSFTGQFRNFTVYFPVLHINTSLGNWEKLPQSVDEASSSISAIGPLSWNLSMSQSPMNGTSPGKTPWINDKQTASEARKIEHACVILLGEKSTNSKQANELLEKTEKLLAPNEIAEVKWNA